MANLFEYKERRVIPNWRSFDTTLKLSELSNKGVIEKKNDISILSGYFNDWKNDSISAVAGDLLSAAVVNGLHTNSTVIEFAKDVLMRSNNHPRSTIELAEYIIHGGIEKTDNLIEMSTFSDIGDRKIFQPAIHNLRNHLVAYPDNAIRYVDLSRLYSIIGSEAKSLKYMKIALQLSKNNRFILRAASRLFSHYGKTEFIYNVLKKSDYVKYDPWILATEISLATVLGKTSSLIKQGLKLLENANISRKNLSELAAAIATSEYFHGNGKKPKKLFKLALIEPNDNSLAQVEWVNEQSHLIDVKLNKYNVPNNFEAIAYNSYIGSEYIAANQFAIKWFLDLPFSKSAIMFASFISNTFLGDVKQAINILKAGLVSHPQDAQILNNLAYSHALINECDLADEYLVLSKNSNTISDTTQICNIATTGLIAFRRNEYGKGTHYYELAIEEAQRKNHGYFVTLAKINYARELLLTPNPKNELVMKLIDHSKKSHFKEHKYAIAKLEEVIKKTKSNGIVHD